MGTALQVMGVLHIMDNAMRHQCDRMMFFPAVRRQINAISLFLRRKYTRERLIATCFREAPASAWASLMDATIPALIDWRWGVLAVVLKSILDREVPLRQHWSLARVNLDGALDGPEAAEGGHDGNDNEDNPRRGADVATVDAAIRCPFFWAYAHMMELLACCSELLCRWLEGCACHGPHVLDVTQFDRPRRGRHKAEGEKACPMAGRRAAELAAGAVPEFLGNVQQQARLSLVTRHLRDLTAQQRLDICADFDRGMNSFMLEVRIG